MMPERINSPISRYSSRIDPISLYFEKLFWLIYCRHILPWDFEWYQNLKDAVFFVRSFKLHLLSSNKYSFGIIWELQLSNSITHERGKFCSNKYPLTVSMNCSSIHLLNKNFVIHPNLELQYTDGWVFL